MTTATLDAGQFQSAAALQAMVGRAYHLGLSATINSIPYYYGYVLEPDPSKNGGFRMRSDTATKDALINYSSGNLIDRDLAYFPRVTDGDFSGGGYQEVWLTPNRYFDSDLDPRVPGFLQLRPQWARKTQAGITPGPNNQVISFGSDFFYTFGESNGNVYSANGGATGTAGGGAVLSLDTDGTLIYAGTATGLWSSTNGASWTAITSSIHGTASAWWVINQGTNGFFAYYQSGPNLVYKIDLTLASPQAAAAQPQVLVGGNAINVVDVVEYQTSVAILTTDQVGIGFDVWYFDGTNLTRIVRMDGYHAHGICNCLGTLYISIHDHAGGTSPMLAEISSGTFSIVARPGSPFPTTVNQSDLGPRAAGQYVYWPLINPSIKGISTAPGVVIQYDTISGAVMHLPNQDATDFTSTGTGTLRSVAALADSIAICYVNGSNGILQYQKSAFGALSYQSSGWLASSHIDFATPGIAKRFRRIEVHHAPLNAGEQILIEAFTDRDPLAFSTALTPVPSGATATNSTAGTTITSLTFGADTLGKTLYFALKLTGGSDLTTTPRVSYVSIEVGGTHTFEVTLACSSTRRLLTGEEVDAQGVSAKSLAYLILLGYEQGALLTLYHRNGQSYTVAIESYELWTPSPQVPQGAQVNDEEYFAHVVLRQVA